MLRKSILGVLVCSMAVLFATSAFAQVQVHGFVQNRIAVANNDYTVRMDRFGLRLQQTMDEEFDWLTEFYVHPYPAPVSTVYMESAYLNWHMQKYVPWDLTVRFGKGRNETFAQAPYYSRRRTSDYTLFSEAFTQSRVQGVQTFSTFGKVSLNVGVINPLSTATGRQVPDMPTGDSLRIPLGDGENADNGTDRVAISGRVGYMDDLGAIGAVNVGGSVYMSETGPGNDNEQNRYAVDAEIKTPMGFLMQAQALTASTNGLDHNGGEILGGWESATIGLYGRYGMLSYDDKLQGMNQIMVSALWKARPAVQFRIEALINGEDEDAAKGWTKCDNDVIFFESLFAW